MITLYLMSEKGLRVFESFVRNKTLDLIDYVVIGEDKSVQNDYSKEIKLICETHQIQSLDKTAVSPSNVLIAISWRWMIQHPTAQIIVIHDSILPKYRGFAPLVNMLINGEEQVGATALIASGNYDSGPIVNQKSASIKYPIKIKTAIELMSGIYVKLIDEIISKLKNNESLNPVIQDDSLASYSLWRDAEDYTIKWSDNATKIKRFIDAVGYPYAGALTTVRGQQYRILDAEEMEDVVIENRTSGKVIFSEDDLPTIVCGEGLLKITRMTDLEGKNALPLKSFRLRFE